MDTDAIAALAAGAGLLAGAVSVLLVVMQIRQEHRRRTLEFVSAQFDQISDSREALREASTGDGIMAFAARSPKDAQALLSYVYVLNRVGAGLATRSLDESVVFNIWSPEWFIGRWEQLEPLVEQEWSRRPNAAGGYRWAEWLAKERCPEVKDKYPADRLGRWWRRRPGATRTLPPAPPASKL